MFLYPRLADPTTQWVQSLCIDNIWLLFVLHYIYIHDPSWSVKSIVLTLPDTVLHFSLHFHPAIRISWSSRSVVAKVYSSTQNRSTGVLLERHKGAHSALVAFQWPAAEAHGTKNTGSIQSTCKRRPTVFHKYNLYSQNTAELPNSGVKRQPHLAILWSLKLVHLLIPLFYFCVSSGFSATTQTYLVFSNNDNNVFYLWQTVAQILMKSNCLGGSGADVQIICRQWFQMLHSFVCTNNFGPVYNKQPTNVLVLSYVLLRLRQWKTYPAKVERSTRLCCKIYNRRHNLQVDVSLSVFVLQG